MTGITTTLNSAPKFAPGPSDDIVLLCPVCREADLSHGRVDVYDRNEDEAVVSMTAVTGRRAVSARVPNEGSGNPSARRHGLTIEFHCESCGEPMTAEEIYRREHTAWLASVEAQRKTRAA